MEQPIRILMLFTIMNRGGAETMVMNYYRHIDRSKVQFDFVVHREERGAYDDEIEALGGRIYRMMPLHPLTFGKYKKQISRFFDEHTEYRIIHGHCSESGYFIYKEASRRGVPVIIAHAHSTKALFDLKWFFRTWFKHRMRRYVTQIFTCGKESAIWLAGEKMAANAILQRNAIDTKNYRYSPACAETLRKTLNIHDENIVIGHVGSFWKIKNQTFLIDIFQKLHQRNPHVRLLLVGEGELRNMVVRKVESLHLQNYVVFLGSRSDVPDLLKVFDVFVFPSLGEGLSVAMLEAQCAGLPCVVSDTIPKEVAMTDLVKFVSLKRSAEEWADTVLDEVNKKRDRSIYPERIMEAGYDIMRNAQWLQNYYLEQWSKAEARQA